MKPLFLYLFFTLRIRYFTTVVKRKLFKNQLIFKFGCVSHSDLTGTGILKQISSGITGLLVESHGKT